VLVVALTSAIFVFVLMFVPNTHVRLKPGLIGGILTALLFMAWLRLCAALQIGVVKYSKIYGGFAAMPIVLAWTYVSWQIMLFGAELAFALQNGGTYGREQGARHANMRARWQLAVGLAVEMARSMAAGAGPLDVVAFARRRRIAVRLLNGVLDDLLAAGLVSETAQAPGHYLLSRDPSKLTLSEVAEAVTTRGTAPEALGLGNLDRSVRELAQQAEAAWAAVLHQPAGAVAAAKPDTPAT
ncbi:MAG: YhjD/YihY/BrkB family envelope integrity protein, partial [Kiritimatiellae bacterium]|nr:YhjD/YihY/BrkB family envelope integrity protein [Kiritimatiellia bacterium]